VALAGERTIERVSRVPADLQHPGLVWVGCDAKDANDTSGQFNDEQHVNMGDQAFFRPYLSRKKVSSHDGSPVRLQKQANHRI